MVAMLVNDHNQPLDQAWRFTVPEFLMVVDLKSYIARRTNMMWDDEKLGAFEQHLRNLGVKL